MLKQQATGKNPCVRLARQFWKTAVTEACTPGVERYEELRVMPAQEGVHQHNRPLGGAAYVWQRRGRKHTSRWIGFAQLVVHSEKGKKIRQSLPSSSNTHTHTHTHTHTRHMEQRSCIKTQKLYEKISTLKKKSYWDYPGGSGIRNPPANAGDAGSVPELGGSHMPQSNQAREPQTTEPSF